MVENHKDNIFQHKEETEANRLRNNRKLDHIKDNKALYQLHEYVHAGILQQMMQEGTTLTGAEIEQDNTVKYQQHIAGKDREQEDTNE
eukprot:12947313-Heterocapsa_arctica.AAC.1